MRSGKIKVQVRKGDLARSLDISIPTISFYTKLGLFKTSGRTEGGFLYDIEEIRERFEKIKQLKKQGFVLKQIKKEIR